MTPPPPRAASRCAHALQQSNTICSSSADAHKILHQKVQSNASWCTLKGISYSLISMRNAAVMTATIYKQMPGGGVCVGGEAMGAHMSITNGFLGATASTQWLARKN